MYQDWNAGEPLPRVQDAEIDSRKFEQYSMNPTNPANQGKWMAFAAIGYDVESLHSRNAAAQDVINQLRQGLVDAPATQSQSSIYGLRFQVRVRIQGPNGGEGTLVTTWQIDNDMDVPRLITNWLEVYQ
jgi:predicted Zn-dependent peptidase